MAITDTAAGWGRHGAIGMPPGLQPIDPPATHRNAARAFAVNHDGRSIGQVVLVLAQRPEGLPRRMIRNAGHSPSWASVDVERSAATMTVTRGNRSTNVPASGARSSTGTISATTTALTPNAEPVRSNTNSATATRANTSPDCDTVRADHNRR